MASIAQDMVRDALNAFVEKCTKLPYEVIKRDDEVDNLNAQVFNELLFYMIQDPGPRPVLQEFPTLQNILNVLRTMQPI